MQQKFVLTIFSVLFTGILFAQNSKIEGVVYTADSVNTLPGVNIYIDKTNHGATTNGNGNFILTNVPKGKYVLTVSSIGFSTIKKEVEVGEATSLKIDFYLTESISTLPEVVVMTKGNTGLKDIPGSVQFISPKELQKFSYTDINRTLRAVPGVNVQEEDGFGLRPNIGLRGTGVERSSKITIMEDGILMAPAPYSDPSAYYFPTLGRMQAIEILKGSSQIKYGPFTTGGAINLVSTSIPDELTGRVHLTGGSFGGRNMHVYAGNSHKNFGYLAETFQYSSNGFKELDGGGNTGFDKKDYLVKFRVNTNKDAKIYQSLTFKIGQTNEVSNETYLGLTREDFALTPYRRYAGSQKDLMQTSQSQYSATHFAKLTPWMTITTSVYHSEFARNWYKLDKVKDSTGTKTSISSILDNPAGFNDAYAILTGQSSTFSDGLYMKANNRSYYGQGIQTVLGFQFKTGKIAHSLDAGFRLHRDEVDRFQWEDKYSMNNGVMQLTSSGAHGTESNRVGYAEALATYLQYKIKYGNLTVVPGIRYENILIGQKDYGKTDPDRTGIALVEKKNKVDVYIPGIGVDYQFSKYFSAFAGVHKGFSPPGYNDETIPEESFNYELGTRYTKNYLSGQLVVFYNDYSNLLGSDLAASGGGGTGDLFNAGEVISKGIEFQCTYDLLSFKKESKFMMPLTIVYTYTDAVFQNSFASSFEDWGTVTAGDHFPYLANNQFTIMAGIEHHKFGINVSGKYMGEMRTVPGQGTITETEKTDSYFILDASANYSLHKNMSIFGNIVNLTNDKYVVALRPSGLRPGMPRAFTIGLKANF